MFIFNVSMNDFNESACIVKIFIDITATTKLNALVTANSEH